MCHGCGHDAHTAILLGAAAELVAPRPARAACGWSSSRPRRPCPAARRRCSAPGVLDGVEQIYALHCDPRMETGQIGLRVGAITAACDQVDVAFSGPGGHTARPHLTADLVYAIGLVDHRTARAALAAGRPARRGVGRLGFGRCRTGGERDPDDGLIARHGARARPERVGSRRADGARTGRADRRADRGRPPRSTYGQGVPPVVNARRRGGRAARGRAQRARAGRAGRAPSRAWAARTSPGTSTRSPARWPGSACALRAAPPFDLHQGTFDIDEDALDIGVRYTVALAEQALRVRLASSRGHRPGRRTVRRPGAADRPAVHPAVPAAGDPAVADHRRHSTRRSSRPST